jgi:hypothetical protein
MDVQSRTVVTRRTPTAATNHMAIDKKLLVDVVMNNVEKDRIGCFCFLAPRRRLMEELFTVVDDDGAINTDKPPPPPLLIGVEAPELPFVTAADELMVEEDATEGRCMVIYRRLGMNARAHTGSCYDKDMNDTIISLKLKQFCGVAVIG